MAESKKVTKYADEHLYKKIIEGDKTVAQLKEEVEEDVASLQESINKTTQSFADEAEVQEKQASLAVKDYAYPDNLREKFKYNNPCFELHFNKGISVSTEFEGIQMENNDDLLTNYNADFIDCSSDCYASYSTDMGCLTLFASPGVDTDNGYALWYSKRAKDYTYPKFDTSCGITIDTSIKFKSLPISDDISTDIQTQGALLEVDAAAGDLPVSLYFKFLGCEESVEGETHNLAIGYAPTVTRGEDSSGAYNNVSYDYITTKIDVGENAKFHRFTFVYDSAKQLSIYVDGELLPNTPIDLVDCFLHEGSTSLNMVRFLACANSNYQNQLEVLFDDFAIYNGFKAIECVEQEDNSLSFNVVEINNIPEGGLVGTLRYMNCYTLNEYLSTLLGILEDKDYFMMTDESDLEESITSFINKIITQHIHSSHSSYIKELEEKAKELLTKITYSNNIEDIIPIPYSWDGVNTEESNRINQILEYGNVEDPNYSPIGYPFAWTNSLILFYPGINPIHYVFSVPGKVTNARLTSNEWTHYVFQYMPGNEGKCRVVGIYSGSQLDQISNLTNTKFVVSMHTAIPAPKDKYESTEKFVKAFGLEYGSSKIVNKLKLNSIWKLIGNYGSNNDIPTYSPEGSSFEISFGKVKEFNFGEWKSKNDPNTGTNSLTKKYPYQLEPGKEDYFKNFKAFKHLVYTGQEPETEVEEEQEEIENTEE